LGPVSGDGHGGVWSTQGPGAEWSVGTMPPSHTAAPDGRTDAMHPARPGFERMVMGMPALCMGNREPTKERGNLLVGSASGPNDHMPVVREHTVGKHPQGLALVRLLQDALEGGVILVLPEQGHSRTGAVSGYGKPDRLR